MQTQAENSKSHPLWGYRKGPSKRERKGGQHERGKKCVCTRRKQSGKFLPFPIRLHGTNFLAPAASDVIVTSPFSVRDPSWRRVAGEDKVFRGDFPSAFVHQIFYFGFVHTLIMITAWCLLRSCCAGTWPTGRFLPAEPKEPGGCCNLKIGSGCCRCLLRWCADIESTLGAGRKSRRGASVC